MNCELLWALWAIGSAHRAGLTLESSPDLVLHILRYLRVIVAPASSMPEIQP